MPPGFVDDVVRAGIGVGDEVGVGDGVGVGLATGCTTIVTDLDVLPAALRAVNV